MLNEQIAQRFENEKSILGKLKHHHIAALIDAGVVADTPYIATEWVDGQPINEYVNEKHRHPDEILKLFLQACDAVGYAHQQLIIHRDLKPANILVDKNSQVKLLDFGIAKLIDSSTNHMTQTQVFTPDYASPEQINGQLCSTETDVYALGVLLFELLVGERRFNHETKSVTEKIAAITQPITEFASHRMLANNHKHAMKVRGALDTIINKAMHTDPARRYDSVYALVADIERFQQHRPIKAMGDSWWYRIQMFIKRNTYSTLFGGLLLMTLTGGIIYTNAQKEQAVEAQLLAQDEAEKSQQMLLFFMTMLESASPVSGGSTQISVKEMFVEGSEKVDLNSISNENTRALIAGQIGEIFNAINEYELALEYYQEALAYYSNDVESHASSFLHQNLKISNVFRSQNLYEKALENLDQAYDKVKEMSLKPEVEAEAKINFGLYFNELNQPEKALQFFNAAEAIAIPVNDVESLGKVKYYQFLLLQDGLPESESIQYLKQAEKYFEQAFPKGHPNLLAVRNSLALGYSEKGLLKQSNEMFKLLHIENEKLYGVKDVDHLTNHAGNLFQLGQFNKAYDLVSQSLNIFKEQGIDAGFNFMAAKIIQSRCLIELGRFDEAKLGLDEAFVYFKDLVAQDHVAMMVLRTYQLDLMVKSGQYLENTDEEQDLMQLADKQLNESVRAKRRYVNTAIIVASSFWLRGQFDAALSIMKKTQVELKYISKKQGWRYWLIQAGIMKLKQEMDLEFDGTSFSKAKDQLSVLLPPDHWYHKLFE